MGSHLYKESFFILTVFLVFALPAFWQLTSSKGLSNSYSSTQVQVVFPKEGRVLASLDSDQTTQNCVLRQKTKSLCGQTQGESSCPKSQTITYWHCNKAGSTR